MRAPEALEALSGHLRRHGLTTKLYAAYSGQIGVLSVACGVTVWTDGKVLCWHMDGEDTRLSAADHTYAARTLIQKMGGEPA